MPKDLYDLCQSCGQIFFFDPLVYGTEHKKCQKCTALPVDRNPRWRTMSDMAGNILTDRCESNRYNEPGKKWEDSIE